MRPNETSRAHKTVSETRSPAAKRRGVQVKTAKDSRLPSSKRVKRRFGVAGPERLLIAACVIGASCLLGAIMSSNYAQFRQYDAQKTEKAQQLSALQTQHDAMKRRLAFLQLPKGREQVLIEHGYLKPGERNLLFPHDDKTTPPATPTTSTRARSDKTALAETPRETPQNLANEDAGNSAWSRTGSNVSRWWNDVNRATGSTRNATP